MKRQFLLLAITTLITAINSFAQKHTIGEKFGGGIVYYVDSSGEHGVIGAVSDQKEQRGWMQLMNAKHFVMVAILTGIYLHGKSWTCYIDRKNYLQNLPGHHSFGHPVRRMKITHGQESSLVALG